MKKLSGLELRIKKLGFKFRRQYSIGKYIVDFYCSERKLIIEVDGSQHINRQRDHDKKRDRELTNKGFRFIKICNNNINQNVDMVIEKIILLLNKKE
jgi:very-short-patch-repair endonuclease